MLRQFGAQDPGVVNQVREQATEMNFWQTRSDEHAPYDWHAGFSDYDMPCEVLYDWIKYHSYDESTGEFNLSWRDEFD